MNPPVSNPSSPAGVERLRNRLNMLRALAPDGDWINARLRRLDPAYRVVRERATRDAHIAASIRNERWHTGWLLLGLVTTISALTTSHYTWAAALTIANVAFNLYP